LTRPGAGIENREGTVDGAAAGGLRSEGFDRPVRRCFSLGVGGTAWIDEVQVWKVT
jgi:hypothetical protein